MHCGVVSVFKSVREIIINLAYESYEVISRGLLKKLTTKADPGPGRFHHLLQPLTHCAKVNQNLCRAPKLRKIIEVE